MGDYWFSNLKLTCKMYTYLRKDNSVHTYDITSIRARFTNDETKQMSWRGWAE